MTDRQMLPILEQAEAIQEAVATHQVVVVCGETGSGKSTQLPQLMRAIGRGVDGMIGHTQPRRIAARALATRIAEETGSPLGQLVGYRVRFSDQTSQQTRIKLLTDGMLLAETSHDPQLKQYDTLIIDEAHERSLNIDFLLGYLKRLLPVRPDLRVIITSATIDPQRFSEHFDQAPIIEVSGRTWPVELRYRPPANLRDGVIDAVDELGRCGQGDILVFLPGEREIRHCAEALRKQHPPHTEVVPLFGRLSVADQQRVFAPHRGRRIVLATNVAETSLTVPGIRYVVDSGLARISRYSFRTRIQRLPIEPVSQASAQQRSGRCGREGPGVCIRLYEASDFEARPAFTEPEILRTNLASVILQMKHLRLGEIDDFPFVEAPDPRLVRDGLRLLEALEALDTAHQLTALGKKLARLPVDPSIGRMLLAGAAESALSELLVLAAALSVQDPRDRPLDHQQAADAAHAKWQDKRSDFLTLLNLWAAMKATAKDLKRRPYEAWCREHFLSSARLREWQEVHGQLRGLAREMGLKENAEPADRVAIHRALLAGLLNAVALREDDEIYRGARDLKLAIHPGSGVAKRKPRWIVAAELVETSRVFARLVAEVRPEWIEPVAKHLLKAHYHSPFWDAGRGKVFGRVDMTLYGLPVVSGRKIDYARVSTQAARAVFIQDGLLGQYPEPWPAFLQHNRDLQAALEKAEAKARRRDLLLDAEQLAALYECALPSEVVDVPSLARWIKRGGDEKSLKFSKSQLIAATDHTVVEDFPDTLKVGDLRLPLSYTFEPGDDADGVTVRMPVAALNALEPDVFEWLVPGLLAEKVMTLIRALPKRLRRHFVPVPEFAAAVLEALPDRRGSLEDAVRRELRRMTGIDLPGDVWDELNVPAHLMMRFLVMDAKGKTLAAGRDLAMLQQQWGKRAGEDFRATEEAGFERADITDWDFGSLPDQMPFNQGGAELIGYPALCEEKSGLALRLLDSPDGAAAAHHAGVRALLMKKFAQQARLLRREMQSLKHFQMSAQELCAATFDRVFLADGVPRDQGAFMRCCEQGRDQIIAEGERLSELVSVILQRQIAVQRQLKGNIPLSLVESYRDLAEQLEGLIYTGFLLTTPAEQLNELPRFLSGMARRIERMQRDPSRDQAGFAQILPHQKRLRETQERHQRKAIRDPALTTVRWMIEEYRVSLFAQELGTRMRVSEKRLAQAWADVR